MDLVVFKYFLLFVVVMEEFVVRVFQGGKVTVLKRLRELFGVEDGRLERIMKERERYMKETESEA